MRDRLFLLLVLLGLVFGLNLLNNARQGETCANSISCLGDLSGEFKTDEKEAIFQGQTLKIPSQIREIAKIPLTSSILGETTAEKRIEVDLTNQKLYAFEGDKKVFDFFISSGQFAPTPTGEFRIWVKLHHTKMEGGIPGTNTYYYLANVPYVMFFYNNEVSQARGFSLHGTYWHNNFGHPMSHGCVNMRTEDVAKLYAWANPATTGNLTTYASKDNPGIKIVIYGKAPKE